jgi:CubicO group peptidase (beta-lactamase class C family)
MIVQDLLRHTAGLVYGQFGDHLVHQAYRAANVSDRNETLAEMVTKLSKIPLAHQPGEVWEYSMSTDVLGRIVEVVSGQELDTFIAEHITRPLGMHDTGFYLSASQASRLARPDSGVFMAPIDPTVKPALLSGGGGMLSTAGDYARFCQMLLNGGELEGVRILAPKTVALMTSDQLPPATDRHSPVAIALDAFGPTPEMAISFGLGFAVRTVPGRNPVPGSVGDFSWAGIAGTFFWVDPKEKLVTVLMMQVPQAVNVPYWRQTRTLVYQALIAE